MNIRPTKIRGLFRSIRLRLLFTREERHRYDCGYAQASYRLKLTSARGFWAVHATKDVADVDAFNNPHACGWRDACDDAHRNLVQQDNILR